MKLQDAITRFYRRCSAMGVSENTITNYRYQAKALLKFFYAREIFFVENITPDDIRAYLAYMRDCGYAPDTIRDRFNGMSTLFRFLCEDGVLVQNPATPVKKPKEQIELAMTLLSAGNSYSKVVSMTGISKATLVRYHRRCSNQ